jgi:hypothetical protein
MDTFFVTSEQVTVTTVGELRRALSAFPDDLPVFSGGWAEHPQRGVMIETANWRDAEKAIAPVVLFETHYFES